MLTFVLVKQRAQMKKTNRKKYSIQQQQYRVLTRKTSKMVGKT